MWSVLLLAALLLLALWRWARRSAAIAATSASLLQGPHKILLVTAHPDDEAFFFTPTVVAIMQQQPRSEISLLCLSSGNAAGLGKVREKELRAACKYLNLQNCTIIEDDHLQDGHKPWDASVVQRYIASETQRLGSDTVITFDEHGVSSHPNHCSTAHGAIRFFRGQQPTARPMVEVFTLTTVPLLRKYVSIFDVLVTPTSEGQLLCVNSVRYAWHAMALHASQFVWYRRAFVLLSRYSLVNNLRRVS